MQLSTISVFYKQRNNFFFPVTSYALPTVLLRVPLSVVTGIIFTALTYFVVGFAPDAGRCACLPAWSRTSSLQPSPTVLSGVCQGLADAGWRSLQSIISDPMSRCSNRYQ